MASWRCISGNKPAVPGSHPGRFAVIGDQIAGREIVRCTLRASASAAAIRTGPVIGSQTLYSAKGA
jgi:hypothetical protein